MRLFTFLFFALPFLSFGQTTITGTITDQASKEALSFASIAVPNSTTGTMSNNEGQFEINLKEDQTEIQISYIGYIDTLISIDPNVDIYTISLKPYEYELTEIVVRPLSPLEYIKEALEKYPSLMVTDPFETRAFFATRSSLVNDKNGSYTLGESVFKTYFSEFANDTLKEDSQLLLHREKTEGEFNSILEESKRLLKMAKRAEKRQEKKKRKNPDLEEEEELVSAEGSDVEDTNGEGNSASFGSDGASIDINGIIGSGPTVAIKECKSIPNNPFFDSEYFKKFKYTFGEQTTFQGRELIKINFSNKRKVDGGFYTGSVYLDYQDLAIVAIDYNAKLKIPGIINVLLKTILGFTVEGIETNNKIRNQKIEGLWYPKEYVVDLQLQLKQKKRYETIATAQILNIEEIILDSPAQVEEAFLFDPEVESIDQIHPMDDVSWETVNIINFDY